jgi:predicted nuclease of predicted toxin-antitoxin system
MELFADENVALPIVVWLRNQGNNVVYAAEVEPGVPDIDWLEKAEKEERLVVTADKDFGEMVFRDHRNTYGVILLRMERLTVAKRITRLEIVWPVIEANPSGKFIVITEKKIRVRSL